MLSGAAASGAGCAESMRPPRDGPRGRPFAGGIAMIARPRRRSLLRDPASPRRAAARLRSEGCEGWSKSRISFAQATKLAAGHVEENLWKFAVLTGSPARDHVEQVIDMLWCRPCLAMNLKKKIKELENSNKELKEAQSKLVHSAKMTSLGQLVAGVAHELNNPIGFIYSNTKHLKDYSEKLIQMIEIAEKNPHLFQAKIAEFDFDYIKQDLPKLHQHKILL